MIDNRNYRGVRTIEGAKGHGRAANLAFAARSVALLGAMAVDFLSVVGRHIGWPLLGAIGLALVAILALTLYLPQLLGV